MAKRSRYTIEFGKERETFEGTAHEAARKAARLSARGTFKRSGTIHNQSENAKFPDKVRLLDESGVVVMNCRPSIVSPGAARAGRRVRYTFASCTIKPGFKRLLRKRRKLRS